MRGSDFVPIALGSNRVVALLNRLVLEVVHLKEIKGGFVAPVNQHSKLQVIELIVFDGLDEGDLDRVVFDVDASGTVGAQEYAMIHAHMRRVRPT